MKYILTVLVLMQSALAIAAGQTVTFSFGGCRDGHNQPVEVREDATQKTVFGAVADGERTTILHNSAVLSGLLPESRVFLFAYFCEKLRMGGMAAPEWSVEQARRADCAAAGILEASHLVRGPADLDAVRLDITTLAGDWSLLPGPARELRFESCPVARDRKVPAQGNVLGMPPEGASDPRWNACVQGCGARLYACGRAESCTESFHQCSAACGR